jgi:enoyl-CoA hydratase/carnithine racemase
MLLALVHDKRVALGDSSKWCMSELNIGISIYDGYAALLKHLMHPHVAREVVWGNKFSVKEFKRLDVINEIYSTDAELDAYIQTQLKAMGQNGHFRDVIKDIKRNLHKDLYRVLMEGRVSPLNFTYISGIRL